MREIDFAIFDHGEVALEVMKKLLKQLEADKQVRVNLEIVPWRDSWSRMLSIALYKDSLDVAELGNTWVGDIYRMDALRPFEAHEIQHMGGQERFIESCWDSVIQKGIPQALCEVWSIPWSADPRAIYYRRDILRKAGLDERTAFADTRIFENTLARLQDYGVETPLVLPTVKSRLTLHNVASWVWANGGDFVDPNFSKVTFLLPESLQGFVQYFRLGRFLPKGQKTEETDVNDLFFQGKAAMTIGGHWLLTDPRYTPEMWENIGVAQEPGVPFIGGEHLVVWKHSRRPELALHLIQFLVNSEAGLELFPLIGLPASLAGLNRPPFSNDPHYSVLAQSLRVGRYLPVGPLWGMVENRLTEAFPLIWDAVLAEEKPDIEAIVRSYLEPVAKRLNITLQS